MWQGVIEGMTLVKQGIGVRVSDDRSAQVWDDEWVGSTPLRIAIVDMRDSEVVVPNLIIDERGWDFSSIFISLLPIIVNNILSMPFVEREGVSNRYVWR